MSNLDSTQRKITILLLFLNYDLIDHVCNTFNFLQGSITVNGLLVDKTDVICYKRSKTIFKRKPATKKCQIFVFDKGVVLAEKVENKLLANDGRSYVLTHWTTFPVKNKKNQNV